MSTVGIKELKNRLTHYLRLTQKGEEVIVTDRGQPVAVIHQITADQPVLTREGRLAQLAAQVRSASLHVNWPRVSSLYPTRGLPRLKQ